jgi:hypothetical protein
MHFLACQRGSQGVKWSEQENAKAYNLGNAGRGALPRKDQQMFQVNVNKYSHEGSAFSRVLSEHLYETDAKAAADRAWKSGHHRFVFVTNGWTQKFDVVYNPAKEGGE